jgi:O-antigen ligase
MAKTSLFLFLIFLGFLGSWSPLNSIPVYKIIVLLLGSTILFYIASLIKWKHTDSTFFNLTPLSILFLLFLLWSALGYLYSADPEKSLFLTIQSLSAVLLYLGLTLYIQEKIQLENILRVLLAFGGLIALIGIIQQFPVPFLKNQIFIDNNSSSIFVHRNVFAGYLVFLFPLSCLIFFSNSSKLWKSFAGVSFILFLTALGFSGSRGGQLVAIIELVVIIGYKVFEKDRKEVFRLLCGIVISVVLYSIVDLMVKDIGVKPSRTSINQLLGGNWWQSLNRILFWQGAWEIFKDHWLIGSGPLSFAMLFPKYYIYVTPIINGQILSSGIPPHAHNLFIQTASDSGLIGLGLMLAFLAIFYLRAYKLLLNSDFKTRLIVFHITLALTSYLLHGVLEYEWSGSMFISHFTIFIFIINFIEQKQFSSTRVNPSTRFLRIVPVLGVLILFPILIPSVQFYKYHSTLDGRSSKKLSLLEYESLMAQAIKICPKCDRPHLEIAEKLLTHYRVNPNDRFLKIAKSELIKGRELNPYNPKYMGYLGQIFAIQGDYDQALSLIKEAAKFYRTHHIIKLGLTGAQLKGIDHAKNNDDISQ